ncbi:MAG: N-acetyltransferase [Pacificimonas sp.]
MAEELRGQAVVLRRVESRADYKAFVDLPFRLHADDPAWRPPLKSEVLALIGGAASNPWFLHARAAFWLAYRGKEVVGRISAQIDDLVLEHMGAGTGQWGMFECVDDQAIADALFTVARDWLSGEGMTRMLGPFSLSIWDEPGLLVQGHDIPPTVMMGHHPPYYERLVTNAGYKPVKDLLTYELPIAEGFTDGFNRIVKVAEKNQKLVIRRVDKSKFDEEAALILDILNDAWSDNWGFVPLTDEEVAYVGKKLKPIVFEDLIRIAEVDGEPVGFMMTLPDINELTADLNGKLFPFGWAKLLWRLRKPKVSRMRVPLMGVRKSHQSGRLASFMAILMIEYIRRDSVDDFQAVTGEFGWVLDDNKGMVAIAEVIDGKVSKIYRIYEQAL